MPNKSTCEEISDNFQQIKVQLTSGIKQQSLGNFTSPPCCYTIMVQSKEESKQKYQDIESSGNKQQQSNADKGQLKYTGPKKYLDVPSLSNYCMCKEFVTVSFLYPKSHQKEYRFSMHVHFDQLTAADKKIMTEFCRNSHNLSLSHTGQYNRCLFAYLVSA